MAAEGKDPISGGLAGNSALIVRELRPVGAIVEGCERRPTSFFV